MAVELTITEAIPFTCSQNRSLATVFSFYINKVTSVVTLFLAADVSRILYKTNRALVSLDFLITSITYFFYKKFLCVLTMFLFFFCFFAI